MNTFNFNARHDRNEAGRTYDLACRAYVMLTLALESIEATQAGREPALDARQQKNALRLAAAVLSQLGDRNEAELLAMEEGEA